LREPRWNQLHHDLAVVDFRLAVEKSAQEIPELDIEKWVPEGDFLVRTDTVEYHITVKSNRPKSAKRGVRPDGYFVLVDNHRLGQGLPARARFLVEMDMATHDLGSFVVEKAVAGWHYIQSHSYKDRFGDNSGCWLVVTTTETRRKHLMGKIHQAIGASAKSFLFTTQSETAKGNVLSYPIWWQVGKDKPMSLFRM